MTHVEPDLLLAMTVYISVSFGQLELTLLTLVLKVVTALVVTCQLTVVHVLQMLAVCNGFCKKPTIASCALFCT